MVGGRCEQQNNATEKQNETKLLKKKPQTTKVLSQHALLARRLHTDNSKLS